MEISFERGEEHSREQLELPAYYYNSLHLLFSSSKEEALFIPIRHMQYLSIIDKEEVVFIDGAQRRYMKMSWQKFKPHVRENLQDPVPYERVVYKACHEHQDPSFMPRIIDEFFIAVRKYREKHMPEEGKHVILPFKAE